VCVCVSAVYVALRGYDIACLNIPTVDDYISLYTRLLHSLRRPSTTAESRLDSHVTVESVDAVSVDRASVDAVSWRYYMVYVMFRTAAIVHGVHTRFMLGTPTVHFSLIKIVLTKLASVSLFVL